MVLGRHSHLKSVGELHHLYNYLNDNYYTYKTKEDFCTCAKKVLECDFWKTVVEGFAQEGKDLKQFKTRYYKKHSRIAEASFKFMFALLPVNCIRYLSKYSDRIREFHSIANNL